MSPLVIAIGSGYGSIASLSDETPLFFGEASAVSQKGMVCGYDKIVSVRV